jgi:hypothetical protein
MPSDNNHIDNFLRQKAGEASVDASMVETGWNEMQTLLRQASLPPAAETAGSIGIKKILSYAAGILVIAVAALIILPGKKRTKSKKPVTTANTAKPLPATTNISGTTQKAVLVPLFVKKSAGKSKVPVATGQQKLKPEVQKNERLTTMNNLDNVNEIFIDSAISPVKPDPKTIYNNFYNELKKPAQVFMINNRYDTAIACKEGSRLFIPAGSFQLTGGGTITSDVKLSIQEFYSFADIISNKLGTTSNGMPLETGGMLSINATAIDQEIRIRPGASLQLKMPARSFTPEMQLFTGQPGWTIMDTIKRSLPKVFDMQVVGRDTARVKFVAQPEETKAKLTFYDGINWMPQGQQQYFYDEKKKNITIINITDNPYAVVQYKNKTKLMGKFKLPYNSPLGTEEMKSELEKKYGRWYDKIKVKREWKPLWRKNRSKEIRSSDWFDSQLVGDSVTLSLSLARRLKLITTEDSIAYEAAFLKQLEDARRKKKAYEEFLQKKEQYDFHISNLGWINADRFLDYPKSRLTTYEMNPGPGFEGSYFQAILIFEKENAAMFGYMQNGLIRFENLPVGHRVSVVCTGVKEGKMYCSVQTVEIEKFKTPLLKFEETSPEHFRSKLSQFGQVTLGSKRTYSRSND